jgi:hypothetical protein
MKHINDMTIKDFRKLPFINNQFKKQREIIFTEFVLLPVDGRSRHDSGYRLIDFVACIKGKPIGRLSGCSDVLHVNGISKPSVSCQYKTNFSKEVDPDVAWRIDCLPKSGLFRMFCDNELTCDYPLSSFQIYSLKEPK